MTDRDTVSYPPDSSREDGIEAEEPSRSAVTSSTDSMDSGTPGDVLTAIADSDCQTILAESAEQPLSVSDVVEQCDIPTATAYRKVNMLVDAGLLHERIQIRPYGRNEHKYSLRIDTVRVNITDSGCPEATITLADGRNGRRTRYAITDGGRTTRDGSEESGSSKFGSMFVDLTGTEEVVDEQETERSVRHLADDGDRSVSEYVSSVTRDDGLSDSLPEPGEQTQE